jgi:hypothetical protein
MCFLVMVYLMIKVRGDVGIDCTNDAGRPEGRPDDLEKEGCQIIQHSYKHVPIFCSIGRVLSEDARIRYAYITAKFTKIVYIRRSRSSWFFFCFFGSGLVFRRRKSFTRMPFFY